VNNDSSENPYTFAIRGQTSGTGDTQAPTATLLPAEQQPIPQLNSSTLDFVIRYDDDQGLSVGSFDNNDVLVTGPNGFSQTARFVSQQSSGTTQADVTYRLDAPGGTLDATDDGDYTVTMLASAVSDTGGNFVAAGVLGTLDVDLLGARSSLGSFGLVNGRRQKLTITEPDGTIVIVSLSNGTGEAFRDGNRIDLEVTSNKGKLSIVTRGGGNGRAEINDIRIAGALKNVTASSGDVDGVVISSGELAVMTFGSTDGATISTPAPIKSLKILGDMNDTQVFSGTLLGLDGRVGGTGIASDQFGAGEIRKFNVTGSVNDSLIAAGLDPVDGVLTNGNDNIVGGAASRIRAVTVRGTVDNDTTFAAGAFPRRAKIGGQSVDPLVDSRFDSTP
jgi:hypothetical protein